MTYIVPISAIVLLLFTLPVIATATTSTEGVGHGDGCCNITDCSASMSYPTLSDVTGNELTLARVNQMVFISTTAVNCGDNLMPFVAIIEARDKNDITVYLQFQTGELEAGNASQIGLSWSPEAAGNYELRSFLLSDLEEPQIRSEIWSNKATIIS